MIDWQKYPENEPPDDRDVLVYENGYNHKGVSIAHYWPEQKCFHTDEYQRLYDVTHWAKIDYPTTENA